jgi:hypothetical protein
MSHSKICLSSIIMKVKVLTLNHFRLNFRAPTFNRIRQYINQKLCHNIKLMKLNNILPKHRDQYHRLSIVISMKKKRRWKKINSKA